jgi:hypothetical protein
MATKKNSTPDTPPKTRKVRRRQNAPSASAATEAPAGAEVVPSPAAPTPAEPVVTEQAVQTPGEPTAVESLAEGSGSVWATPAAETTAETANNSPEPTASAPPLSALDAAAKVLGESGQAMSCKELITTMAVKGYWQSPKGRTPASTLYSALLRELHTKGKQARFIKVGRGTFALRGVV